MRAIGILSRAAGEGRRVLGPAGGHATCRTCPRPAAVLGYIGDRPAHVAADCADLIGHPAMTAMGGDALRPLVAESGRADASSHTWRGEEASATVSSARGPRPVRRPRGHTSELCSGSAAYTRHFQAGRWRSSWSPSSGPHPAASCPRQCAPPRDRRLGAATCDRMPMRGSVCVWLWLQREAACENRAELVHG